MMHGENKCIINLPTVRDLCSRSLSVCTQGDRLTGTADVCRIAARTQAGESPNARDDEMLRLNRGCGALKGFGVGR